MGQEFGDDGKLIKYSDLFDYSSLATLQASSWLPTPKKVRIHNRLSGSLADMSEQAKEEFKAKNRFYTTIRGERVYYSDEKVNKILDNAYNLDDHLKVIATFNPELKAERLRELAETIIDMYDAMDKAGISEHVNLTFSPEYNQLGQLVVNDIIKHEKTIISPNLEEAAYKNSISSSIKNIVQDLKNMDLAYSPISMDDLQDLAEESEKGAMVARMSLMNPLTKYLMLVQNMVGKKVIGIAAVGEKVFFNLSYYYNEGVRSGDELWIRNLLFSRKFNRILGRYAYANGKGEIETVVKTQLANVNFSDSEVRKRFVHIDLIDRDLRKRMGITNEDITLETELAKAYQLELTRLSTAIDRREGEELVDYHKRINKTKPVDLLISLILSAATDNAKELILDKINCGENLAKCHLYLSMLGFDIKDVVTFMTSPCISLINKLSEANMMDSYVSELRIDDAMKIAEGIIPASKFLFGVDNTGRDMDGYSYSRPRLETVFAYLVSGDLEKTLLAWKKTKKADFEGFSSLEEVVLAYIQARIEGVALKPLEEYALIPDYETNKGFTRLSDYVEKVVYLITLAVNNYSKTYLRDTNLELLTEEDMQNVYTLAIQDFTADLAEFKNIYKLANETTTLGGVFLGMNQGLPSSKEDLQGKLRKIKEAVSTREREFGIFGNTFEIKISDDTKDVELATKRARKRIFRVFKSLAENNSYIVPSKLTEDDGIANVTNDELFTTLELATAFGIVGNFNVEKWLYDTLLTAADVVAENFYGNEIDKNRILLGRESISYREVVANYYNVIKGTWNIFDMMNKIPQYKAIINLLKTEYVFDKHSSIRSELVNLIYDEVYALTGYIDERQNKKIILYVNDLLIISYFRNKDFSFPVLKGVEYSDAAYATITALSNLRKIDLNNAPGRAAFKKAFEAAVELLRSNGEYMGELLIPNYESNVFLLELRLASDLFEVPRLTPGIDMMRINSTPATQKTFLEYLNGLLELKEVKINGVSFTDWLILYNLFTNLNQYGSDRLTTMFKNHVANNGSVLEDYFQYIGNLDYLKTTQEVLNDIEYNIDDLLIRMAPTVQRSEELSYAEKEVKYIRSKNADNEYVIKRLYKKGKGKDSTGIYKEISTFPGTDLLDINSVSVTEDLKANYAMHLTIPMLNQDFLISLREGLMSTETKTFVNALMAYSRRGILQIFKRNC